MVSKLQRLLLSVNALLVVLLIAATAWQWYRPSKMVTLWRVQPTPYVASESDVVRDVDKDVIPTNIEVYRPTEKQQKKIDKASQGRLPIGPLISAVDIKEMCAGGTVFVSLVPGDEENTSRATVTVVPNKLSFFAIDLKRELSIGLGRAFGASSGEIIHLEYSQDLVRTGPATWYLKGGVFSGKDFNFGYVEAGAKILF